MCEADRFFISFFLLVIFHGRTLRARRKERGTLWVSCERELGGIGSIVWGPVCVGGGVITTAID